MVTALNAEMSGAPESSTAADCPRCGYDLSGVIGSWTDSCPLTSRCSECGFDVDWPEVLSPRLSAPAWSFEHGGGGAFTRLRRAWARALNPARLWSELRVSHPIRIDRLVVFCLLVLLGVQVVTVAFCSFGWGIVGARGISRTPWSGLADFESLAMMRFGFFVALPYVPKIIFGAAPGLTFATSSFWLVMLPVLFVPAGFLVLRSSFRTCRVRSVHLLRGLVYSMVPLPIIVAFPLGANVLFTHLYTARWGWRPNVGQEWYWLHHAGWVLQAVWLAVAWWFFSRRYLKIAHPIWVVSAMLVMAWLATLAVLAYFPGSTFLVRGFGVY